MDRSQVIRQILNPYEMKRVNFLAEQKGFYGHSTVHADVEKRMARIKEEQISGQMCEAAFSKYQFGDLHNYLVSRIHASQHPYSNDGGSDIPGTNIDIKGRHMWWTDNPMNCFLAVREKEFKEETIYVHAARETWDEKGKGVVYLIGWIQGKDIDRTKASKETHPNLHKSFYGAYITEAKDLNPLMPIKWWEI